MKLIRNINIVFWLIILAGIVYMVSAMGAI